MMHSAANLEEIFNRIFEGAYQTVLVGGAGEPLYRPAGNRGTPHRLFYREDYFSSALHEISHWCIAGEKRRQQLDFGYWYNPDGRNREQQRAFEQAEIKPQALEWIFSNAAGIRFRVSADNLSSGDIEACGPSPEFLQALEKQAVAYCKQGLPLRAQLFVRELVAFYRTPEPLACTLYAGRLVP